MVSTLGTDDLTRLSDLLVAADTEPAPPGGLPDVLLEGLMQLVPCDLLSFNDFDIATRTGYLDQECDGSAIAEDRMWPQDSPFLQHFWSSVMCSYPNRTGDDRTVITLSDFYGQRAWEATPMYRECFVDLPGVQHELMCSLPSKGTRTRRVLFFRQGTVDFDDRDRMLLALLRPHLAELRARQEVAPREHSLTARQTELLRLVASGRSTAQVAETLFLSTGTVRKHLENIFDRLGVTSRTAAVMRVFADEVPVP